jgi:hypothetical protein
MLRWVNFFIIYCFVTVVFSCGWSQDLKQSLKELEQSEREFSIAIKEDKSNKGAKLILDQIKELQRILIGFDQGRVQATTALRLTETLLTETRKYKTEKTKRLTQKLEAVVALLRAAQPQPPPDDVIDPVIDSGITQLPPTDSLPSKSLPARQMVSLGANDNETKILLQNQEANLEYLRSLIYLIGGVNLIIIALLAIWVIAARRSGIRQLEKKVFAIEKKLIHLSETGSDNAHQQSIKQLVSRLEKRSVENNTHIEQLQTDQAELVRGHQWLYSRLQQIEQYLGNKNGFTNQVSSSPNITPHHNTNTRSSANNTNAGSVHNTGRTMTAADVKTAQIPAFLVELEHFQSALSNTNFRIQTTELINQWKQLPAGTNLAEVIDPISLANWLQQFYVITRNQPSITDYELIGNEFRKLGIEIEDQMEGRMSFSDQVAENIPCEKWLNDPRANGTDVPELAWVKTQVQRHSSLSQLAKRTVVCTLKPAVFYLQTGGKALLSRGLYLIAG